LEKAVPWWVTWGLSLRTTTMTSALCWLEAPPCCTWGPAAAPASPRPRTLQAASCPRCGCTAGRFQRQHGRLSSDTALPTSSPWCGTDGAFLPSRVLPSRRGSARIPVWICLAPAVLSVTPVARRQSCRHLPLLRADLEHFFKKMRKNNLTEINCVAEQIMNSLVLCPLLKNGSGLCGGL
jgi:hypothetical protein